MTSFFSVLVDFYAHSQYAHIAIFLLALSEAIPVVGTLFPAQRSSSASALWRQALMRTRGYF